MIKRDKGKEEEEKNEVKREIKWRNIIEKNIFFSVEIFKKL